MYRGRKDEGSTAQTTPEQYARIQLHPIQLFFWVVSLFLLPTDYPSGLYAGLFHCPDDRALRRHVTNLVNKWHRDAANG